MSRSVTNDYDKLRAGGRGFGKTARAKQSAAQYARDQIADGVDPGTLMHLADVSGHIRTVTYEEAAEMAFISDIIDKEIQGILERETA